MGAFAFGLNVAWVSAAVPSLKSCDTDNCKPNVHITDDDESWIGGIFFLGSMVASPVSNLSTYLDLLLQNSNEQSTIT